MTFLRRNRKSGDKLEILFNLPTVDVLPLYRLFNGETFCREGA